MVALQAKYARKGSGNYLKVLQENPNEVAALTGIGRSYLNEGDYVQAEKYLKQAIEINPQYHVAWNNLGWVYEKTYNYTLMLDAFEQAIKCIQPKYDDPNPMHFIGKARALNALGEYHLAISTLEKIDRNKVPYPYTWNSNRWSQRIETLIGFNQLALGELDKAKISFKGKQRIGIGLETNEEITSVVEVIPNGPADLSDIKVGDVILTVNGESIHNFKQVIRIIHGVPIGEDINFVLKRTGEQISRTVDIKKIYPLKR